MTLATLAFFTLVPQMLCVKFNVEPQSKTEQECNIGGSAVDDSASLMQFHVHHSDTYNQTPECNSCLTIHGFAKDNLHYDVECKRLQNSVCVNPCVKHFGREYIEDFFNNDCWDVCARCIRDLELDTSSKADWCRRFKESGCFAVCKDHSDEMIVTTFQNISAYCGYANETASATASYRIVSDNEKYWNVGEIQLMKAGELVPISMNTCSASSSSFNYPCESAFDGLTASGNLWSPDWNVESPPYWIQFEGSIDVDTLRLYQLDHAHAAASVQRSMDGGVTWSGKTSWSLSKVDGSWSELSLACESFAKENTCPDYCIWKKGACQAVTTSAICDARSIQTDISFRALHRCDVVTVIGTTGNYANYNKSCYNARQCRYTYAGGQGTTCESQTCNLALEPHVFQTVSGCNQHNPHNILRSGKCKGTVWSASALPCSQGKRGTISVEYKSDESDRRDPNDTMTLQIDDITYATIYNTGCYPNPCFIGIPWFGTSTKIVVQSISSSSTDHYHMSLLSMVFTEETPSPTPSPTQDCNFAQSTSITSGNPGAGTIVYCPAGQTKYGDGSACSGGGRPNCKTYGNPGLPLCSSMASEGVSACQQAASWVLTAANKYCSTINDKQVASNVESITQCQQLVQADSACGNTMYTNGANRCWCLFPGKTCAMVVSYFGDNVYTLQQAPTPAPTAPTPAPTIPTPAPTAPTRAPTADCVGHVQEQLRKKCHKHLRVGCGNCGDVGGVHECETRCRQTSGCTHFSQDATAPFECILCSELPTWDWGDKPNSASYSLQTCEAPPSVKLAGGMRCSDKGLQILSTLEQCATAATSLGLQVPSGRRAGWNTPSKPAGCFTYDNWQAEFNADVSSTWMDGAYKAICVDQRNIEVPTETPTSSPTDAPTEASRAALVSVNINRAALVSVDITELVDGTYRVILCRQSPHWWNCPVQDTYVFGVAGGKVAQPCEPPPSPAPPTPSFIETISFPTADQECEEYTTDSCEKNADCKSVENNIQDATCSGGRCRCTQYPNECAKTNSLSNTTVCMKRTTAKPYGTAVGFALGLSLGR